MEDDDKSVAKKERNKVIETEDASRGPLSGCIRLADSSRVIQRLKVNIFLYIFLQKNKFNDFFSELKRYFFLEVYFNR